MQVDYVFTNPHQTRDTFRIIYLNRMICGWHSGDRGLSRYSENTVQCASFSTLCVEMWRTRKYGGGGGRYQDEWKLVGTMQWPASAGAEWIIRKVSPSLIIDATSLTSLTVTGDFTSQMILISCVHDFKARHEVTQHSILVAQRKPPRGEQIQQQMRNHFGPEMWKSYLAVWQCYHTASGVEGVRKQTEMTAEWHVSTDLLYFSMSS